MKSNTWEVIHDCDTEDGNPTCWSSEINHKRYGKYVWISETNTGFDVEVNLSEIIALMTCKSLTSAKRWVSMNLK